MTLDLALDVHGLQKAFGDVRAIAGLDRDVAPGQVHGLVGPNGAGKTTLLRILFGLVAPDAGTVSPLGHEPAEPGARPAAGSGRAERGGRPSEGVAVFVEDPRFYPYLTARRNLELMADLDGGGDARIDE